MKEWPDEGPADFEDCVEPFVKILREYFKDRQKMKPRKYDGFPHGEFTRAGVPDPDQQFNAEGLEYNADHDRDIIDLVVASAFQIGVEQGRRICEEGRHAGIAAMAWNEGWEMHDNARHPDEPRIKCGACIGAEINAAVKAKKSKRKKR